MIRITAAGLLLFLTAQCIAPRKQLETEQYPADWIYVQRAWPYGRIKPGAYHNARQQAATMQRQYARDNDSIWENVGPTNIEGRVTDILVHPSNSNVIYVGAASGGIFRTMDGGTSWEPIFDDAGSISIGALAMDPNNPNVIYAGTGEANGGYNSAAFPGNGVYKSTDGGNTWTLTGLDSTHQIGRIAIDPNNTNRIFVAAMGEQYGSTPHRGVYRSDNAGVTWQNVLHVTDTTGCIDLAINPRNSDTVYAAMWERRRYPWNRDYAGPTSGVYRSTDGGGTWQMLQNGLPASTQNTGRIGIAIARSQPQRIYAVYSTDPVVNMFDGVYRSDDGGDSWIRTDDGVALSNAFGSFGWYFGNIRVDPTDPEVVYVLGYELQKSTDGGVNWTEIGNGIHVDHHALVIREQNPDALYLGNDGGVYFSNSGGASWSYNGKLPITQFYACDIDPHNPQRYLGGTQDNGTLFNISNNSPVWTPILGGDGFYTLVNTADSNILYAEWQNGNLHRSDDRGGWMIDATTGIDHLEPCNWSTPVEMDPSDPDIMYYGTNHVYQSTDGAFFWNKISPDLTDGPSPGPNTFGTLTTIDVSPVDNNYIYAGTDDGNVWVTQNTGGSWTNISAGLPKLWVSRVAADPWDPMKAYVTFSGYGWSDYQPHVFVTTNAGASYVDITGDLPQGPVNDIIPDPDSAGTLYVATDFGVFITYDHGLQWQPLGSGMPLLPVLDIDYDTTGKLLAATHGRSMWTLNLPPPPEDTMPPIGVTDLLVPVMFSVTPNPASDYFEVRMRTSMPCKAQLTLVPSDGKLESELWNGWLTAEPVTARVSSSELGMAPGFYLVKLRTSGGMLVRRLVVK